jgi:hypothetical protein
MQLEERFKLLKTKKDEAAANEDLNKGTGKVLADKSKDDSMSNLTNSLV